MIAKDMMPWMFVNRRKAGYTPFAKVRCEGGRCTWTVKRPGDKPRRAAVAAARQ